MNGQDKIEMINLHVNDTNTVIRINLPMNGQDKVARICYTCKRFRYSEKNKFNYERSR